MANSNKIYLVVDDNDVSEEFSTLEEAREYVEENYDDNEVEDVNPTVYEVTKKYSAKRSGVELEEEEL